MPTGEIKKLCGKYCFIGDEAGPDIFCHLERNPNMRKQHFDVGDVVEFRLTDGARGSKEARDATRVRSAVPSHKTFGRAP